MNKKIYRFNTKIIPSLQIVGGKAKALMETKKYGLPVPDGLVLSVYFFETWIKQIKQTSAWQLLLENFTKENCHALQHQALSLKLEDFQKEQLAEYFTNITSLYAVRSSSPEEDLLGTSFAGMYETILGVTHENLEDAITKIFSSIYDFRVLEYKIANGLSLENTCIAIIIQEQIASEVSGIAFSLNPLTNAYDEAIINASYGLGEAIVSGLVTPDTYIISKLNKNVFEKTISNKNKALYLNKNGGTSWENCASSNLASLNITQLDELIDLINKCETYYHYPVDIEWAYANNQLYLLQVRPITTYFSLDKKMITKPGEPKQMYIDMIGCTQGFSEPLSVLGLDLWAKVINEFVGSDMMPINDDGLIIRSGGKLFFNVNHILKSYGKKTGFKILSSQDMALRDHESLVLNTYKTAKSNKHIKKARWGLYKKSFTLIKRMNRIWKDPLRIKSENEIIIEKTISDLKKLDKSLSFDTLVSRGFEILSQVTHLVEDYSSGEIAKMDLNKIFEGRHLETSIDAMASNLDNNPTALMTKSLYAIAENPEMIQVTDAITFESKWNQGKFSNAFNKQLKTYLHLYGDRGLKEIDIATPRIKNDMKQFYMQIKLINLDQNILTNLDDKKRSAIKTLKAEAKKLKKLKKVEKNILVYENIFGFRESPKYILVLLVGLLHDAAIELGKKYVSEGKLNNIDDIFSLHLDDIIKAKENCELNLRGLVLENTKSYINLGKRNYPTNIDSRGKILIPIAIKKEGYLTGEAISSGLITGTAKVLNSPFEKIIEPGDILVTHATEPTWTPVFINASAIVLEVGGILQHGAIIAREYGLPCVSGIHNATSVIKDGDIIEVDGTNGYIRIVVSAS